MTITVAFHGACGVVTGSCFELRTAQARILIDCGMFQGTKSVKALNYGLFPFDVRTISAAVVTHAHIDHCGLLPKLVRAGYSGPIVATPGTADLLTYVLPDSGHIQELEVERLNRRNRQRARDEVEPIYTREDAEACLRHVTPRAYDKWIDLAAGIRLRFWNAAHILGSASIELLVNDNGPVNAEGTLRLLFSGDIGPGGKAIQGLPQAPADADFVFAESTYGDRVRAKRTQEQRQASLLKEILAGLRAGGMVLVPAFAVERTQEFLVDLDTLFDSGALPPVPVFVDSPLASRATEVFAKHLKHSPEFAADDTHPFKRANLTFTSTIEESQRLSRLQGGGIIIAGSGMCDAGRIRHHLKTYLSNSATTLLLIGYQAPGTLGRLLVEGAPMVRIQGEEIAVAARVRLLDEYSGHADQNGLKEWIAARASVARKTFLIHGEDAARTALRDKLIDAGCRKNAIHIPALGETVKLSHAGARTLRVRARLDAPEAAISDWHNAFAETTLRLRQKLERIPNERERQKLLKKVQAAIR